MEDYIPFRLAESQDVQRDKGANAEFTRASDYTIKSLNKELKEQAEIFFKGVFMNVLLVILEADSISHN